MLVGTRTTRSRRIRAVCLAAPSAVCARRVCVRVFRSSVAGLTQEQLLS